MKRLFLILLIVFTTSTAYAAGAAKETFDAIRAKAWNVRTWNMFDFLATCVGGFAGVFILIVVFKIN